MVANPPKDYDLGAVTRQELPGLKVAMTGAERSRLYRERHPYGPGRADYRRRFGRYEMAPHCESFESENCTGEEGKLLPHHVYYLSCPACRGDVADEENSRKGDGIRGHCTDPEHLLTVCVPCHQTIHKNSPKGGQEHHYQADYRLDKFMSQTDAHMAEIAAVSTEVNW